MSVFVNDRYDRRGQSQHRSSAIQQNIRTGRKLAQSSLLFQLLLQKLARDVHDVALGDDSDEPSIHYYRKR